MSEVVTPQRAELLRHILSQDQLEYVEEKFAGKLRLELCRRTRAIVIVTGQRFTFHLPEEDHGSSLLDVRTRNAENFRRRYPDLWAFACHRAAEAMLALRNGHKESVRVRAKNKRTKELQQRADV